MLLGAEEPAREFVEETAPGVTELFRDACERVDLGALDEALAEERLATVLDESLVTLDLGFDLAAVEEDFLERVLPPAILNSKQKVRGYET